jgi:hypothetical protein
MFRGCSEVRSPDGRHCARHLALYGTSAVNKCNRCRYIKHQHAWGDKCTWVRSDGMMASWLAENPDKAGPWFLTCAVCPPGKQFGIVRELEPQKATLQLEDLLRHGNHSKSQTGPSPRVKRNKAHDSALQNLLRASRSETGLAPQQPAVGRPDVPISDTRSVSRVGRVRVAR